MTLADNGTGFPIAQAQALRYHCRTGLHSWRSWVSIKVPAAAAISERLCYAWRKA